MKLYIKQMVSSHCIKKVEDELKKLGIKDAIVDLGEVEIEGKMSAPKRLEFAKAMKIMGYELIDAKKTILVEKIKYAIIKAIHYTDKVLKANFSAQLSKALQYNYKYLSNVFSSATGTTIEQIIIKYKIERAKLLIMFDELTLTEIAHLLQYSSVAHLSNQFKKITGLTPTTFKRLEHKRLATVVKV